MENRDKILKEIESSKAKIHCDISEIGDIIHKKTNLTEAIKKHPFQSLCIGTATGFALAMISVPFGRIIVNSLIGSAIATASAHYSKKGLDYLSLKYKNEH